jgi:cell division protein FtsW
MRLHRSVRFKPPQMQIQHGLDLKILGAITVITLIGLILVYDVSVVQAYKDFGDKYFYIRQQIIWVILGFLCLGFFSVFDYHLLKKFALPFFLVSFLMLLLVQVPGFGTAAGGAHRWLRIGGFSIQPAEIIKLASVIFFATLFEHKSRLGPFTIIVVVVCAIIGLLQKDLGSASVYFFTSIAIYLISGAPLKYFYTLIPVSIIGFLLFIFTSDYRKQRILAFLDPFSDPQGYSYHISQVLIALGSGGLTGLGLGQSRQKFEYIPEVTTDSIFAIVGEELGFIGAVVLISLLCYLIYRGLKIAESASDNYGKILAFGLTAWLGIQALINLAAMVSLIPLTGVPLPFISYGGSALLANLVAVGILLNISKRAKI